MGKGKIGELGSSSGGGVHKVGGASQRQLQRKCSSCPPYNGAQASVVIKHRTPRCRPGCRRAVRARGCGRRRVTACQGLGRGAAPLGGVRPAQDLPAGRIHCGEAAAPLCRRSLCAARSLLLQPLKSAIGCHREKTVLPDRLRRMAGGGGTRHASTVTDASCARCAAEALRPAAHTCLQELRQLAADASVKGLPTFMVQDAGEGKPRCIGGTPSRRDWCVLTRVMVATPLRASLRPGVLIACCCAHI